MPLHQEQLVFAGDPDPEDDRFFGRFLHVIEALNRRGLTFDFEDEETSADGTLQLCWVERVEGLATITLVKDLNAGPCHAMIEAPRRADVRKITSLMSRHLDVASLEMLQDAARSGLTRDPEKLVRLAMALPEGMVDGVSAQLIRDALDHRFPHVRRAAAIATGLTRWPGFINDLEALIKAEGREDVLNTAREALRVCQRVADREASARR